MIAAERRGETPPQLTLLQNPDLAPVLHIRETTGSVFLSEPQSQFYLLGK